MKKNLKKKSRIEHFCKCFKNDGSKCQARAMWRSSCCFFHSPSTQEARKAAQQRGGRANGPRVLPEHTGDLSLRSEKEIALLVEQTVNQLLKGEIDPKPAGIIGNLASTLIRLRKPADIEERVSRLEKTRGVRFQERPEFDLDRDLGAISSDQWKWENPGSF